MILRLHIVILIVCFTIKYIRIIIMNKYKLKIVATGYIYINYVVKKRKMMMANSLVFKNIVITICLKILRNE